MTESNFKTSVPSDVAAAFYAWPLWGRLGWEDTKLRYRRSILGPLWLTIGTAIMVVGMGMIWSILWGMNVAEYFPYLAAGFITWQWISAGIIEGTRTFSDQARLIQSFPLPLPVHSFRLCVKLFIGFAHNLLVFIGIAIIFSVPVTAWTWAFVPGMVIIYLNCLWVSLLLGIIALRYRDLTNILEVIMGLMVFLTPIMWKVEMLGSKQFVADLNPFTHYIAIIRSPLLGEAPTMLSYGVTLSLTAGGCVLAYQVFKRQRAHIAFWI